MYTKVGSCACPIVNQQVHGLVAHVTLMQVKQTFVCLKWTVRQTNTDQLNKRATDLQISSWPRQRGWTDSSAWRKGAEGKAWWEIWWRKQSCSSAGKTLSKQITKVRSYAAGKHVVVIDLNVKCCVVEVKRLQCWSTRPHAQSVCSCLHTSRFLNSHRRKLLLSFHWSRRLSDREMETIRLTTPSISQSTPADTLVSTILAADKEGVCSERVFV